MLALHIADLITMKVHVMIVVKFLKTIKDNFIQSQIINV